MLQMEVEMQKSRKQVKYRGFVKFRCTDEMESALSALSKRMNVSKLLREQVEIWMRNVVPDEARRQQ